MNDSKGEFMLLFRGEHWDKNMNDDELRVAMDRVMAWFDSLRDQGRVRAGQPLAPEGRIVSSQRRVVADGPFAESKEAVGGYLIVSATSLEQAIELAKSCPTLDLGITIEVRPILDECPVFKRARERLFLAAA